MSSEAIVILYELLTLSLLGFILCHSIVRIFKDWENRQSTTKTEWIRDGLWVAIVVYVLTLWPHCSYPLYSPRSFFLFATCLAVFPGWLIQGEQTKFKLGQFLKYVGKTLLFLGCLWFLVIAVQYLLAFRPVFVSGDFFHYVVIGRDMGAHVADLDPGCYFYFPGVYRFWQMALHFTDGSLNSLQWVTFAVLSTDALLIGAIIHRILRNFYMSTMAAFWFIFYCARFGGFDGITEPIAILPILMGLLLWGGNSLVGKSGFLRTVALGIGLGLGLYVRQHAGFVSLGAISLLVTYFIQGKSSKIVDLKALVLLPLIAASVVIIGILFEGRGFQPLLTGIFAGRNYDYDAGHYVVYALSHFTSRIPLFTFFAASSLVFWLVCISNKKFHVAVIQPWFQMLGFTLMAGLFSTIPFLGRYHGHYTLFSGAMLILSSMLAISAIVRIQPAELKQSPPFYFLIIVLAVWPFIGLKPQTELVVWPQNHPAVPVHEQRIYLKAQAFRDYQTIKEQLQPFEKIYVLPPSETQMYFFLKIRYPTYGWHDPFPLERAIQSPGLNGVLLMNHDFLYDYYLQMARRLFDYDSAPEILRRHGFEPALQLERMTLWRPTDKQKINANTQEKFARE